MRDQPRTARVAGSRELRRGRARGAGAAPPAPDASPPLGVPSECPARAAHAWPGVRRGGGHGQRLGPRSPMG